ncbi:MAG: S1C family serine protease [Spirochaetota bacterium]
MRRVRGALLPFHAAMLAAVLVLSFSCSSPPVREQYVKKLDARILEEFDRHREEGEFFPAARSYIEYLVSADDSRTLRLAEELADLYDEKMQQLELQGEPLRAVEYTHSLISLLSGRVPGEQIDAYRERLNRYLDDYLGSGLSGTGDLERASRLLYAGRFTDIGIAEEALARLFMERRNPVLARRYLERFREAAGEREEPLQRYQELKERLELLAAEVEQEYRTSRNAVEETVSSSVKVLVDKGIKTERGMSYPDQALGSGIVIDQRGYVITNHHIIESSVDPAYEGYSRVYVVTGEGRDERFTARVVGYDPVFDLALLKIEKELESLIRVGDSDSLRQGQRVLAIGNPVGLTKSVTSGVVSSLDRPFLQLGGIIQIDAALNPGNSGGALIDQDGYLVGVTFAGLESFEGLNFAIPSRYLLAELFKLYRDRPVKRSWVGCTVAEDGDDLVVTYLAPVSPAVVSGLRKGDVILQVDGKNVSTVTDIQEIVAPLTSPLVLTMTVRRDGRTLHRKVYLEERPVYPSVHIYERDAQENIITPLFGMVLSRDASSSRRNEFIVEDTLQDSAASRAGIVEGDQIRLRDLKYDSDEQVFYLVIDLKSRRFGYLSKSLMLYQFMGVNSFI